ncbi:MAG: cell division protein FtsK, partial [Rhizobacter sp.]|nr:cell division protein FtsK [Rhizobacter sp.]
MTFPLGSLRAEADLPGASNASAGPSLPALSATYTRTRKAPVAAPLPQDARWRLQIIVFVGAIVWFLAVLALVTHNSLDAAWSTSGRTPVVLNKAGVFGAWFSDMILFLFGYSAWWLVAISLRNWLGTLARLLRSEGAVVPAETSVHLRRWFWAGVVMLLAASTSLEWTRLYQGEPRIPGNHAGGVFGYLLGSFSMKA